MLLNIDKKELKKVLLNIDKFHDAIADATDGTNPTYFIEGVGHYTLYLEDGTGSTLIEFEGDNYYIIEFIEILRNLIKTN